MLAGFALVVGLILLSFGVGVAFLILATIPIYLEGSFLVDK